MEGEGQYRNILNPEEGSLVLHKGMMGGEGGGSDCAHMLSVYLSSGFVVPEVAASHHRV